MNHWNFYSPAQLKPKGWMLDQLKIQAAGLSGNLDKVWPDVRDSIWIGSDRSSDGTGSNIGCERVPYWLDGFIPMAYLLGDEDLIARAKRYIDGMLAWQREDGWICPIVEGTLEQQDTWIVQLVTKLLTVYYECSGDERIPDVLYKVLKNYYELLKAGAIHLFRWGAYRWYETFIAINFMYERCGEEWLRDLGRILKEQGVDYEEKTELWKRPINKWTMDTHIVNLAMMLKSEAVSYEMLGEEYTDKAERLRAFLDRYNGTPVALFTGDECLSGLSAIQGTELCAVAEQMYTYELLYAYTGDAKWAELLEILAFNALPATYSDDMWAHQYVQMSNQIHAQRFPGKSVFRTNDHEAHLFGLEPNFGCCTANLSQPWPKLALSAFMYSGSTVLSAVPVPSELKTGDFTITLETAYPFENSFTYRIDAAKPFTLKVRVPSFAENLCVNGEAAARTGMLSFEIAPGAQEIRISYQITPRMNARPHGLNTVQCGSLVFSVPVHYEKVMHEYERNGVERKFPYCDYEYVGVSPWSYGFSSTELAVEPRTLTAVPFSSTEPPVIVRAKVRPIEWCYEDGYDTVCAKIPESTTPVGDEETIELYPYGCAKLRVTELPMIDCPAVPH